MKYYLIVGEASGDLHASHLMKALQKKDSEAQFRFFGGDMMSAVGGTRVRHYRELAYMGVIAVVLHLRTILGNMKMCKRDIVEWAPDVVILVDYPGFNLEIAKYVKANTKIPVYYYISPKIWAWKEYRIKNIRRDVAELFSILPFEVPFFEQKHHYPIHYVGNPTADEVAAFCSSYDEDFSAFCQRQHLDDKPIIALLAGSRQQEIEKNLPAMIKAAERFDGYQLVLAGAPGIEHGFYARFIANADVHLVYDSTYPLLKHSTAALVTSGTATLETALFDVPQVVCYNTFVPHLVSFLRKRILKVKYVSLVNLIADGEIVKELVAADFSEERIIQELSAILPGQPKREKMLEGYKIVHERLGQLGAPDHAADLMIKLLRA